MIWCLFEFNDTKRLSLYCKLVFCHDRNNYMCRLLLVLYNVRQVTKAENHCTNTFAWSVGWCLASLPMLNHFRMFFWDMTKCSSLSLRCVSFLGSWGSNVAVEWATFVLRIRVQIPVRRYAILQLSRTSWVPPRKSRDTTSNRTTTDTFHIPSYHSQLYAVVWGTAGALNERRV
jgi:hypothetical protein